MYFELKGTVKRGEGKNGKGGDSVHCQPVSRVDERSHHDTRR
jgi:hypothetical protein